MPDSAGEQGSCAWTEDAYGQGSVQFVTHSGGGLGGVLKGLALCGTPACTETCAGAGGVGPFGSYAGGAFLGGSPGSHAGDPFGGGAFRGKEAHNSSSSRALELPAGLKSSGMALAVINLALGGGALKGIPAGASAETCACGGGALTGIVSSASAETCAGGGGALKGIVSSASAETCAGGGGALKGIPAGASAETCACGGGALKGIVSSASAETFPGSRPKARSSLSPFVARFSAAVAAAPAATSERFLASRRACRTGEDSLGGGTLGLCTGALDEAAAWAETVSLLWMAWSICKSVMFEEDAAQDAAIG